MSTFSELLQRPFAFLDGAMGTMLQAAGLQPGELPEALNLTHPEMVAAVHTAYLEAGSDAVFANTFGANARKLSGLDAHAVVSAGVRIARQAAQPFGACVGFDIGPIGELLKPTGTLDFDEAYSLFAEMAVAGAQAGADFAVLETFTDLGELRAAILAVKENTSLPVIASMTFEASGRTFTGCTVEALGRTLTGLGADAVGINCSLGPADIFPLARDLAACTPLPLMIKANAGLPDPQTGLYSIDAQAFAEQMAAYAPLGVQLLGGCCGTTPAYIRALRARFAGLVSGERRVAPRAVLCSATQTVPLEGVRVIGERINPTGKKRMQEALRANDMDCLRGMAVMQADAGADILDVNVGVPGLDESAAMRRAVETISAACDLPLQIDSNNPEAIEAGLRAFHGVAIVNSVNGDEAVLARILPIVKKYGACVLGLTLTAGGIPETAEERLAIAQRILQAALRCGIPREHVLIDCLTLTASAQQAQAMQTLRAVRMVHEQLGLGTVLGVSNISFGLPLRPLVNRTFLVMALAHGLTLPIINPCDASMMDAVRAFRVLAGHDTDASGLIAHATQDAAVPMQAAVPAMDISTAIQKGLAAEARACTQALLAEQDGMDVINRLLIPALDAVGERFERGELFLPQLLRAAAAAQEAFDMVKPTLTREAHAPASRGRILLATVEGDIHDIGKNIVKVILENYGFDVLDLGRDVPAEDVVRAAVRENIRLIGLSALMTTTLPGMQRTIRLLRESCHVCHIFVGGAVLTPEYAAQIGADEYAKDAKQSADIAKRFFAAHA